MSAGLWAKRLRQIAAPALVGTPLTDPTIDADHWIDTFTDGNGDRRALDPVFLSAVLGRVSHAPSEADIDECLWAAASASDADAASRLLGLTGPLVPFRDGVIEVWTETELSGVQALSTLGLVTQRQDLTERALSAAGWHLENTQPDNATNRPWGINVFVRIAEAQASPEAELYAQTLLHNAMMPSGTPDILSSCILWQAATLLDAAQC